MILNEERAFGIVSDPRIVQKVPQLAAVHEAVKAKEREFAPKKNCTTCEQKDYFAGVRQQAVIAISQLNAEARGQLKQLLGESTIYVLIPVAGKASSLKKLA